MQPADDRTYQDASPEAIGRVLALMFKGMIENGIDPRGGADYPELLRDCPCVTAVRP